MSAGIAFIGLLAIVAFVIGYFAQKSGLAPPPPVLGIDLGTTFSSIATFQTNTGQSNVLVDGNGRKSIPSVVAFLQNGTVLVGLDAVRQQSMNPKNTIYDAKRFIGKIFEANDHIFEADKSRYTFVIKLDDEGLAYFEVEQLGKTRKVRPEEIGSILLGYLREMAIREHQIRFTDVIISVPAEFDLLQRNYTIMAVKLTGMEVRRVLSEPTAAALAYGLHQKDGVEYIIVVDLGGGTLDVSVLWLNNGVFVVQAMAGNNRLGGQDFNERLQKLMLETILEKTSKTLIRKEDLQQLRLAIEDAKIRLTTMPDAQISLNFNDDGIGPFTYTLTRDEFERANADLFERVLEPIDAALDDCGLSSRDIDEIVLVGGSTQIPRVRQIVASFFGKSPNFGVDPELAVVIGAAVQAGVVANGWPLRVAAMEMPFARQKRHIYLPRHKE